MTDFTARRTMMVDTQVRPSDVTKFPIIDAMLDIRREAFVPIALREAAYIGENLPLGGDRVMLEPRTLGKMLDGLMIEPIHVEDDDDRATLAQKNLSDHGIDNAAVMTGQLIEGSPKSGPYDIITVQGAVEQVPASLLAQLRDGGRIACIFAEGALGVVRIGHKIDGLVNWRFLFNASAPVLVGFEKEAIFTL